MSGSSGFEGKSVQCKALEIGRGQVKPSDRQERVPGWVQAALEAGEYLGAGLCGVGLPIATMLAREGAGIQHLCDPDPVSATNLHRTFFSPEDIGVPKGVAAATRLAEHAPHGGWLFGYPLYFSELLKRHGELRPDVVWAAVDSDTARKELAEWSLAIERPLVTAAVSRDAAAGYVFVQEPGRACLGCYLGSFDEGRREGCAPASMEINVIVASLAVYAIHSLVMKRERHWNLVRFFLATAESHYGIVERNPACPVCQVGRTA